MPFDPDPFRPAPWAPGPHLQTLVARVLRTSVRFAVRRERIETPDGDFLDLDWGPDPAPEAPLVLVLHGLEGSSSRGYVRSVSARLHALGLRPVALNFRGCSGEPNRARTFYHSGATEDPVYVLETLRRRHPQRPLGAVGFSLGGNILIKLMGERADGGVPLLDAAAAISVPYDLAAGCALLEASTMGRVYATYFLRSLREKVRAKRARLEGHLDLAAALAARSLRAFDDLVTAPLHGFEDAAHYYASCSSKAYLGRVRVPTLLVHATDDPFLPPEDVPVREARGNPCLHLLLHERGGHVGFLEGSPWRPRFWADEQVARFLAERLGATPPSGTLRRPDERGRRPGRASSSGPDARAPRVGDPPRG